jgi:hypothetical protein
MRARSSAPRRAAKRGSPLARHRRVGKHADEGHDLSVRGGLAALSLDALSSVAYFAWLCDDDGVLGG